MSGQPGQSTPLNEPARLAVDFVARSDLWTERGLDHGPLIAAARAAYAAAGSGAPAEVAVVLADDAQIRVLNREWAGKDKATDVLSFPADDDDMGYDGAGERTLGDIVLAFETVERDAGEAGIPLSDHASHLVIHGMLHLLGYDHAMDDEAAAMERLETEILAGLGLHDPYGLTAERRA